MSFSTEKWQNFTALNNKIVKSLKQTGFEKPTKIQAQVLHEYKHYYDFLIASQTGSGKTLAFALPILSELLDFYQSYNLEHFPPTLFGLIITPTRQLAQQIQANIKQVLSTFENPISVLTIIGGMSKHRQLRLIKQQKPHFIIGTPGRIHEFLEDEVFNFEQLKYLVIDQADRMIELGHYVQVDQILQKIFRPKKKEFFEKDFHDITSSIAKKDRQLTKQQEGLYIKQNGKKVKLNFNFHSIQSDKLFEVPAELFQFVSGVSLNEGQPAQQITNLKQAKTQKTTLFRELTQQELHVLSKLKRRIFFVSATLTRQFKGQKYKIKRNKEDQEQNNSGKKGKKSKHNSNDKRNKSNQKDQENPEDNQVENIPKLKALLSRVNFSTKPKIIDQSSELFLPEGLSEIVSFTDGENQKICMLLCYLQSLPKNQKTIIFTNTIKASKRVQFFIENLNYRCSNLHSHMEQKQRLTKLERFKKSQTINILISTDVAARGLDFYVSHVLQYGVPINGDTYVHRAGRTARANRTGKGLIIVDRKQGNKWIEINDILNQSVKERKVQKFVPLKGIMDEINGKVSNLQWIRVNNQHQKDARNQQLQQMQAQQVGVEVQEQQKRRKYDLDKQQQAIVRHQVKKKVQKLKRITTHTEQKVDPNMKKWKKNKLILSPEEIMKMM